jgi:4-hydroxy-3-methylbut-2-enyl diphosphate reductase
MLNLNITIDQKSGFCFGVVYAIQMAEEILTERGYLHCLGDIVHNDEEIERLKKKGLITINHEELKGLKNEHVLIRAHGEPPSTYEQAILNNITIIDATCPVVLKLQNRIKQSYDKKENILLFGKDGHAEVIGLMGQINNNGMVFQDMEDLENAELPQNLTLYTQTTKSKSKFNSIATDLKQKGYNVTAHDTICTQVADRDGELRKFATKFDKVVFVAGKKSSNGMVLYNVCKEMNPNTYFVSSTSELNKDWFKENESIGICGATSTPLWLMENVKEVLEKI